MASLVERADGQHQVRWRPGRKSKQQSCTFADPSRADLAKLLVEERRHRITREEVYRVILDLPADEPPDSPTFASWVQQWCKKKTGVEPGTLAEYRRLLDKSVVPVLGNLHLHEITDDHIDGWLEVVGVGRSPGTVRRYHAVLHQVFQAAVGKHIQRNPAGPREGDLTTGLPKAQRFEACFLTADEAELIVRCSPFPIRDMVRVALGTGLRLGELIALRVKDVALDVKTPAVHVRRALKLDGTIGSPKSERSRRAVSISTTIVEILRPLIADKRPDDLVFPAPMGGLWSRDNLRERYWKRAVALAQRCSTHPPAPRIDRRGRERDDPFAVSTCACKTRLHQKPRFHDTRHTHVGWLIEAGWDLYTIQLRVGHESIKTTFDVYGHRLAHGDAARLDALDAMIKIGRSTAA